MPRIAHLNRTTRSSAVVLATLLTAGLAAPALADDETPLDLQALVNETVGLAPGGMAIVTLRDGVLDSAAAGIADATGRPFTPETPLRIDTAIGPLIGAIMLQLVDEGALDLEATVGDYLPDAPFAHDATIASLMDLTAGIPDPWDSMEEEMLADPARRWFADATPDTLSDHIYASVDPSQITPGEMVGGGTPYALLFDIVERLEGKLLGDVVEDRIATGMGLEATAFLDDPDRHPDGLAAGWHPLAGSTGDPDQELTSFDSVWGPASSATDLAEFLGALADGDVVSEKSLSIMFDPEAMLVTVGILPLQAVLGEAEPFEGWWSNPSSHYFGTEAWPLVNPETGDVLVVTANNWDLPAVDVVSEILQRWHEEDQA